MTTKGKIYNPLLLVLWFVISLMVPVFILAYTETNPLWTTVVGILLPLGFYTIFAALSRRSGRMVWAGFIFIFFSAFQIVLSYLFGNSVVATDMFLNLITTNPGEASELLGNIYPSVIAVCIIYLPMLWVASMHLRKKIEIPTPIRQRMIATGFVTLLAGILALWQGCKGEVKSVLRDEVFPINVSYNMGLGISEAHKISHFNQSSEGFTYHAHRDTTLNKREVYVLVIGEASRAANWQLYGYDRATTPRLSKRNDLILFRSITTQSNTTHKSVPMILSSIHTSQHNELYHRSGLPALFKEAGFATYFISNQNPQGAMIDNLAHDADHVTYVGAPRYDMQLVDNMREILKSEPAQKILFILHTYGSHFSYHQRYPREFARFTPDDDVAISLKNTTKIRNAYDNSILYTDHVMAELIGTLESMTDVCSAVYYCADHGEDLMDKEDNRFLHSSPTVTYYQLHVASFAWFSPTYRKIFTDKVQAARFNGQAPATTYSVFHTMADIASISSAYVEKKASLTSLQFDYNAPRYYLDDHNNAVPLDEEIGINAMQRDLFQRAGIILGQSRWCE